MITCEWHWAHTVQGFASDGTRCPMAGEVTVRDNDGNDRYLCPVHARVIAEAVGVICQWGDFLIDNPDTGESITPVTRCRTRASKVIRSPNGEEAYFCAEHVEYLRRKGVEMSTDPQW